MKSVLNPTKDLRSSIKPIFFLCQLFGLHFTGLNFNEIHPSTKLLQFFLRIYSITQFLILVTIFAIENYNPSITSEFVYLQINDLINMYIDFILYTTVMIGNYLNRSNILDIINELLKLDQILKRKLRINVNYRPLKIFVYHQLAIGLFLWLGFIYYYIGVLCTNKSRCIKNYFIFYASNLVTHVHNIQFCSIINAMTVLLHAINAQLTKLTYQNRISEIHMIFVYNRLNNNIKTICIIREIYDNLYDLSRKLNRSYSIRLLITFLNGVIVIFCGMYSILFGMHFEGRITDIGDTRVSILAFFYVIVCCVKFFIVALSCERLVNESKRTAVVIHKISIIASGRSIKEVVS